MGETSRKIGFQLMSWSTRIKNTLHKDVLRTWSPLEITAEEFRTGKLENL